MSRKERKDNSKLRELMEEYGVKTMEDRLASNVSVLQKFSYVMEYSLYKTLAGKHRITMTKAKMKSHKNGAFTVSYETKSGTKAVTFYNGGFHCVKFALGDYVDYTPDYARRNQPKELYCCYKAGKCELCGKSDDVLVHQVSALSDLTGKSVWEQLMLEKRRKTLIVCRDCYADICM